MRQNKIVEKCILYFIFIFSVSLISNNTYSQINTTHIGSDLVGETIEFGVYCWSLNSPSYISTTKLKVLQSIYNPGDNNHNSLMFLTVKDIYSGKEFHMGFNNDNVYFNGSGAGSAYGCSLGTYFKNINVNNWIKNNFWMK